MKIDLEKLSQYEMMIDRGFGGDDLRQISSKSLSLLEEAVRAYLYDSDPNSNITKLLKDYEILVEEESETETPFVKPHNFTTNG